MSSLFLNTRATATALIPSHLYVLADVIDATSTAISQVAIPELSNQNPSNLTQKQQRFVNAKIKILSEELEIKQAAHWLLRLTDHQSAKTSR